MKIAQAFPFYAALGDSIVPGPVDHTAGPGPTGAVSLDQTWRIVVEPSRDSDSETMCLASADLSRFLAERFGITVARGGAGPAVTLRLAAPGALALPSPAAHRVSVAEGGIVIEGRTGAAVMQGVFRLEALFREQGGPWLLPGSTESAPLFDRRIHRSAVSPFYYEEAAGYSDTPYKLRSLYGYDILFPPYDEAEGLPTYYADHVLLGLARHGFNGIWLRGVLRLFSHTSLYPEGSAYADIALPRIGELCRRAARYGISVYIYMNEPMGFADDDRFWTAHPGLRGSLTGLDNLRCLCTSCPEALEFCREGMRDLFTRVPELAGAILITASEFPTHCWSHTPAGDAEERRRRVAAGTLCPRCAERDPSVVVAEVVTSLDQGLKEANPNAVLMPWNWAWQRYEPDPQSKILEGLPRDVFVMGDFERGAPTAALDIAYDNAEYSLKVIGPSQRFVGVAAHQRGRGLPTYAKLQLGTTHENPTVPYMPVLTAIAEKYRRLAAMGVAGMMTCWNFGNMPSLATEIANEFTWSGSDGPLDEVTVRVGARYVGAAAAPALVRAWRVMHAAMERAYPGTNAFLYVSPLSRGPAFPWTMERVDRNFPPGWLLVPDAHADDMTDWLSIFGADGMCRCLTALDDGWSDGIAILEQALPLTRGSGRRELQREIGLVRIGLIQYRSTANMVEFLVARARYLDQSLPSSQRQEALARVIAAARRERDNASAALPLVDADNRLGFHGEAFGYLFNRPLIEAKLRELDLMLAGLSQ